MSWLGETVVHGEDVFRAVGGYHQHPVEHLVGLGKRRIGFSADERKRLIDLDYSYLAKNDAALKEWWDKSFKG